MRPRLILLAAVACVNLAAVTGCTATAGTPGTPGAADTANPMPQITAATTPPVTDLDLEAWSAQVLPDRGPNADRATGVLASEHPMDPVDVSVEAGTGILDIACAAETATTVRVTVSTDGVPSESDLTCAVGVAQAPAVLSLSYPSGAVVTVALSAPSAAVYIVQRSFSE